MHSLPQRPHCVPFVREGLLEKKLTDLKEGSANFLLFVEVRACSYPVPESARPPVRPPARSGRCTSLWSSRAFSTVALPCAQVELYHGNELMCAALSTDPVPFRYGCAAMLWPQRAAPLCTALLSVGKGFRSWRRPCPSDSRTSSFGCSIQVLEGVVGVARHDDQRLADPEVGAHRLHGAPRPNRSLRANNERIAARLNPKLAAEAPPRFIWKDFLLHSFRSRTSRCHLPTHPPTYLFRSGSARRRRTSHSGRSRRSSSTTSPSFGRSACGTGAPPPSARCGTMPRGTPHRVGLRRRDVASDTLPSTQLCAACPR